MQSEYLFKMGKEITENYWHLKDSGPFLLSVTIDQICFHRLQPGPLCNCQQVHSEQPEHVNFIGFLQSLTPDQVLHPNSVPSGSPLPPPPPFGKSKGSFFLAV